MRSEKEIEIIKPISQINLYGYKNYFDSFKNLYEKDKLPNTILISGPKGIGKSTFIYHFINYLLSQDEKYSYSYENFKINPFSVNEIWEKLIYNKELYGYESMEKFVHLTDLTIYEKLTKI